MKSSLLLSAALVLLLPALPVSPAHGQGVDRSSNTRAGKRAQEAREGKGKPSSEQQQYPEATRKNPDATGERSLAKDMEALIKMQGEEGSQDKLIAKADEVLANPKAKPRDKSNDDNLAAAAGQDKDGDTDANALKYYQMALDNDGLSNNTHYRAMLQVAQLLAATDKTDDALKMVDRFFAETKATDDKNGNAIRSNILVASGKPELAVAELEKQLAAKPNDKKIMMNLASYYLEASQDAKAAAMFDKMRAGGLLTESKDYEAGFVLLNSMEGREKDTLALIDEGLKKGILQPSYNMYAVQGRIYFQNEDLPKALDAWSKGAPLAKDGEMYLNVAKLQLDGDHYAAAKEAALQAKAKGVKRQGDIYQVLARAENGLGNKAASQAAIKEAAKYPESQKWAEAALRQGLAN
jgi:predicted Zn-dependent protease